VPIHDVLHSEWRTWKLIDAIRHQLENSNRPRIVALGENRIGLPEQTEHQT
jgi:hypothetical protein